MWLFVSLLHGTVGSLTVPNDRNVLYERIRDTLISHKRSDIYMSSAPISALHLTLESLWGAEDLGSCGESVEKKEMQPSSKSVEVSDLQNTVF